MWWRMRDWCEQHQKGYVNWSSYLWWQCCTCPPSYGPCLWSMPCYAPFGLFSALNDAISCTDHSNPSIISSTYPKAEEKDEITMVEWPKRLTFVKWGLSTMTIVRFFAIWPRLMHATLYCSEQRNFSPSFKVIVSNVASICFYLVSITGWKASISGCSCSISN